MSATGFRARLVAAVTTVAVACLATASPAAASTGTSAAAGTPAPTSGPTPSGDQNPDQAAMTAATTKAKRSKAPVTVDALTTENAQIVANADGTYTWTSSIVPVRVKKSGTWTPIDTTLVKQKDGTYAPKATSTPVAISGGGDGKLATLTNGADPLTVSWPTPLPKPTVKGNVAVYSNVLPDVDLQATVSELGGFSEVLVVKNAAAAANPALKSLHLGLASAGATVAVDTTGNTKINDDKGRLEFTAPAPLMWDSGSGGGTVATQAKTAPLATPAAPSATTSPAQAVAADPFAGYAPAPDSKKSWIKARTADGGIDLTPDAATLSGPGVHYPVYIDPEITPQGTLNQWDAVQECAPNLNELNTHSQGRDPGVGYQGFASACGQGRERVYYDVNIPAVLHTPNLSIRQGSGILHTFLSYAASPGQTTSVDVAVTGMINGATSWNNQPCRWDINGNRCSSGTSATATFTPASPTPNQEIGFDMTGPLVAAVAHGNTGITVGLFNESETNDLHFVRFATTVHTYFSAVFDLPPTISSPVTSPTPHAQNGFNSCPSGWGSWIGKADGNTATLGVAVSSPTTGYDYKGVGANFWMHDDTTNGDNAGHAPVDGNNPQIQLGNLSDGHGYHWWANAYDHYLEAGQVGPCYFTTDFASPSTPAVDQANSSFGPNGAPVGKPLIFAGQSGGTIRVTANDPGGNPSGLWCFEYVVDGTLSSPTGRSTCANGESGAGSQVIGANGQANAAADVPVGPLSWGTHTLSVIAIDQAGNSSITGAPFQFFVPDDPYSQPTPGDLTGAGHPTLMQATADGNLRIYEVGTAPADSGRIASQPDQSPDGTGWNNFRLTAHGSMHGLYVDDLFAHKDGSPNLYLYLNTGSGTFSKAQQIAITQRPGCGCDWSNVTGLTAIGWADQNASNSYYKGNSRNPAYLLAEAKDPSSGTTHLWLYPYKTVNTLGNGIDITTAAPSGTTGFDWANQDLIAPGDASGDGLPDLWTRDRTTGAVYQFSSKHNADGTVDLAALGGKFGAQRLATGMTPAANPVLSSSGDLNSDGNPDLWGTDAPGNLLVWPGQAGGFGAAVQIADVSWSQGAGRRGPVMLWQLGDALLPNGRPDVQGTTEFDTSGLKSTGTAGANNGTIVGGVTLTHEHDGGAANFDGSTGYIRSTRSAVDVTKSFSVSAWIKPNAVGGVAVSQGAANGSGFQLYPDSGGTYWTFAVTNGSGGYDNVSGFDPAQGRILTGQWAEVTGVYDAGNNLIEIYVNGVLAGTATHTAGAAALGAVVAGGAATGGSPDATSVSRFFNGGVDNVTLFDRAITTTDITNNHTVTKGQPQLPIIPSGANPAAVVPAEQNPAGPNCLPQGPWGTVNSRNPQLQAIVSDSDPTQSVHGEFALHDRTANTDVIVMGGAGSASSTSVTGSGLVSIITPTLSAGHTYDWRVRTSDGLQTSDGAAGSPVAPVYCHFTTFSGPSAVLTVTPSGTPASPVKQPVTVTADASGSVAGSASITNYVFDFGDGTVDTLTIPTDSHQYGWTASPTTYTVKVTVNDAAGIAGTTSKQITLASPDTLYVGGPGCSDAGPGSQSQRYCTIGKAAATVKPGGTVLVYPGTYPEQVSITTSGVAANGSTPAHPTTFKATQPGTAIITGMTNGFRIAGRHDISVDGFAVTATTSTGIYATSDTAVSITNNTVTYAGKPVSGSAADGIQLSGVTGGTVSGNHSDHNTFHGFRLTGGTTGVTVSGNEASFNASVYSRQATGIDVIAPNNVIIGNLLHDNEDSGIQFYAGGDHGVAADNVAYNNGDHGIDDNGVTGGVITGNTVYNNCTDGINVEGTSSGFTIKNNIAVDNAVNTLCAHTGRLGNIGVYDTATTGTVVDNNLVFMTAGTGTLYHWNASSIATNYATLAAFQTASGRGAHDLVADPLFASKATGNFRLRNGSPAIDSADASAAGEQSADFDGNTRVDDPTTTDTGSGPETFHDRGAFEFQARLIASLAVSPTTGSAPLTVTADGSGSSYAASPITQYTFDFGDGTDPVVSTTPSVQHSYPVVTASTKYTLTLTVDDGNTTDTTTRTVTEGPPTPLTAAVTAGTPDTTNVPITFDATGSAPASQNGTPIVGYAFDFGDGTTPVTAQPAPTYQHAFTKAGTYAVKVTVTDGSNTTASTTTQITITDPVDYWVGGTGCADANAGTQAAPFCTIGHAATLAAPGSTVHVNAGTYNEMVTAGGSGVPGGPVTYTSVTPGAAIVNGTGGANGFLIAGRHYVVLNGFTVNGSSSVGIQVQNSDNITVSNNTVTNSGQHAASAASDGIQLKNVTNSTVSGNHADRNSFHGIRLTAGSTGITVSGNEASFNATGYSVNGVPNRAANGIWVISPGNVITGNVVHDNEDSGMSFYSDTSGASAGGGNNTVTDNLSYNNGDHGIDDYQIGGNQLIGNTIVHNCTAGINLEGCSSRAVTF